MHTSEPIEIALSDGETIKIEVDVPPGQELEVARGGRTMKQALKKIQSLSEDLRSSLERAAPDKIRLEFGIDFQVETHGLSALLAKGSGSTHLKVTLEWDRNKEA